MSTKASLILFIALILPVLSEEPSSILESFTPTETINGEILALAVAPDGSAYFGGTSGEFARMNADGSLAQDFNPIIDGPVVDLLVQEDEKIIAAGQNQLARFHPDGSADPTFQTSSSNGSISGIDLLPDGRIIVAGNFTTWAGESLSPNRDLIMLNPDGTLRGSFAKGIFSASLTDVVILPDGKILASHLSDIGGTIKVTRFKNDLSQDSGFNYRTGRRRVDRLNFTADGRYLFAGINTSLVQTDGSSEIISEESSNDLFEQRNGKIVVAGETLTRFLAPGIPDPDFSEINFNSGGEANRLALRPDGRIWVAGSFSSYDGTAASRIVLINGDAIPLAIVEQAESQIRDPGETARFEISAVGTSTLFYQWRKNEIAVTNSARITGATSPALEIMDLEDDDSGNYTCLVTNEAGEEVSDPVDLIVRGTPYFVVLPNGGRFPAGSKIHLAGEVIALGTVTYQWRKNGEAILGANSDLLTLSQVRAGDSGSYTLEATNALGRTVSQVAEVTVSFNPAAIAEDFRQPSLNGGVLAIEPLGDGAVLVGGLFSSHLAVIERDGTIRDLPDLSANGAVRAINRDSSGNFLLAGEFSAVNGVFRSRVARLLPDLSVDPTFNPGTGPNFGLFNAREAPDGTIHIAGKHTAWNGDPLLSYHVRLNPDGTVDPLYYTPASNWINDAIPLPDGKILLGGRSFNPDDDTTTNSDNYFFRINEDGTFDASFEGDVDFKSPTKLLIDQSGRIYANSPIGNILNRFLSDGTRDLAFENDRPGERVTSMFLDSENRLLIGGRFEMFDGKEHVRLLRLKADDSIDEGFVSGSGPDNQVDAIAESDDGSIWIGGTFLNYNGVPATNLVRLVGGESPGNDLLTVQSLLANSSLTLASGSEIPGANLDPAKHYYLLELRFPKDTKGYSLVPEGSSNLIEFDEKKLIPFGIEIDEGNSVRQKYYFLPDRDSEPRAFWRLRVVN